MARLGGAVAVLLGTGALLVLGPATNAAAAAMHHTAGTYQLNQTGAVEGSSTIVLEHDHTVQPNDGSSSWSVQHRVVTI
ncbi:MAG TPA: hypothetical protein VKW77_10360, partial [Acidimicrobiales bacterium]|nr:hypothetical protein [Acidimicrobiales bacterium]